MTTRSKGKRFEILIGVCERCGEPHFKCKSCGHVQDLESARDEVVDCYCGYNYTVNSDYIGNGMTDDIIYLINIKGKSKFVHQPK